jgi:uncharacterized protein with beta-barrel porin domain
VTTNGYIASANVSGGAGGDAAYNASAGGGGGGGNGVLLTGGNLQVNSGVQVTGGAGGRGGTTALDGNGGGGGGGFGVLATGAATQINSGAIVGGRGENGGDGVAFEAGGSIANFGSITGGEGGVFGGIYRGGGGITGAGLAIVNSGAIAGGFANAGAGAQADAITFTGGVNSLTLQAGSTIAGNVVAFSAADTFALGGTVDSAFDVSQLSPTAQYRGFGIFEKTGASAWTLNGVTTATTPWTVAAGTLIVNGSIASSSLTTVDSGAALSGAGALGNTSILSGGTFLPGSGVAGSSIAVTGTLSLASGSTYVVDVNPSTASQAVVSGAATLGGTVQADFAPGSYIAKQYTILTAASIGGTFGALTNVALPTNFTDSLAYDSTHAYLDLTMASVGTNVNQNNVANALIGYFDRAGGIPSAYGALSGGGLTQASGEIATGVRHSTFMAMNDFLGAFFDRGDSGLTDAQSSPYGPLAYDDEASPTRKSPALAALTPKSAPVFTPNWSVWSQAYGGSATIAGNSTIGSNTIDDQTYGVMIGADYRAAPGATLGFAVGGGGTHFGLANGLGTGRSDLAQVGVYGVRDFGSAYIAAAAAYGFQEVTTNRTVVAVPGNTLQAKFNANALVARAEVGDHIATPFGAVSPYGALQVTTLFLPAYGETSTTGSNLFALNYASQTVADARTELGARFDKTFALTESALTLSGRLAWAHDFNASASAAATFQQLPGASFVVNGATPAANSALVSAAAEVKWAAGFSVQATFEGEFASNVQSYGGRATIRYAW